MRGPSPFLRLQSDERLVALTRRGNQAAYETLVARYNSRLLAFSRHMLSSREDAEDVLQETSPPPSARWSPTSGRSTSALALPDRAQPVAEPPAPPDRDRRRRLTSTSPSNGTTTADKVHKREEFRQLVADVRELPETQRTALLLREIDALSYDQIAEAMETTVPSVKSLLVRARVSLAEAAEARKLTCEEVREELGEVAEGLTRTRAAGAPPPARLRALHRLPQVAARDQPRARR